jgi:5-methyltetrahydropteroyltriglutamate--homocysteine methyltransferase
MIIIFSMLDAAHRFSVGRENVSGGGNCGFSSQATFTPEAHPTAVGAKFKTLAKGARIATQKLWPAS